MINFIKRYPLYSIVMGIVVIGIILLFICSCRNHHYVNLNNKANLENLSLSFEKTKADIELIKNNTYGMQETSAENVSHELNSLLNDIKDAKREIIKQHQDIFDANTVTFLITFLSALLFTVFITLFIRNMEQFNKLYELRTELNDRITEADNKIEKANYKITEADKKIGEANGKINEADKRIAEAKTDWDKKLQNQEYLLSLGTKRNSLMQILSLVSVLGSHLASSAYVLKSEYATLAYMIQRKIQSLLKEGFDNIIAIRTEDKDELMRIVEDCITYLNIETLRDVNTDGLVAFEHLNNNLIEIQNKIENIPLQRAD